MILDFYEGELDGNTWEKLCQSCYRIRYQNEHYIEIPAVLGGDAGIEGFTQTGIVNQCYYPERNYNDEELYSHLREKMSKDIAKLINLDYKKRLLKLGVPVIKEWHFVIPFYKDSRIIQHAENKKNEVLNLKKKNPTLYDYIDDNFRIIIKQAEDFKFEIVRTIRNSFTDVKLDLSKIEVSKAADWEMCNSDKVRNITRKVKAVMGDEYDQDDFNELVDLYVDSYIKGLEIMKVLRESYAEIYDDIFSLETTYKRQVKIKTMMNSNRSLNADIFKEILEDFEKT